MHNSSTLALNGMHFLGVFNQIIFPEITLAANPHTALHRAREGRVVVDATHMICVLAFNPKRTLLLRTGGPSAEDLHRMIVVGVIFVVPRIVDPMECSKMLGEMIFASAPVYRLQLGHGNLGVWSQCRLRLSGRAKVLPHLHSKAAWWRDLAWRSSSAVRGKQGCRMSKCKNSKGFWLL